MDLFIVIRKKYFDQIAAGVKTEEYREIKAYWEGKIIGREYSAIVFQVGYRKEAPRIRIEYNGYLVKGIVHEFFGEEPIKVFALQLGRILEIKNYERKQRRYSEAGS